MYSVNVFYLDKLEKDNKPGLHRFIVVPQMNDYVVIGGNYWCVQQRIIGDTEVSVGVKSLETIKAELNAQHKDPQS